MNSLTRPLAGLSLAGVFLFSQAARPAASANLITAAANHAYPAALQLYQRIHQHPELSGEEHETAALIAAQLRALGYEVTTHVGGEGLVALLRNGPGATVMLRTELDALPIQEKTGLPYASKVFSQNAAGAEVPVGHMCGHDLHMSALVATASVMAQSRASWHGTLMLIGQPAEETLSGADAMVKAGLFRQFPRPDMAIALHVSNALPAGEVSVIAGRLNTNADSLKVTIFGRGSHGAMPQMSIDPVVIAARTVLSLQTIVAREVAPGDPAVVTVGYLHAGTQNNVIPDQAELGITVRTISASTRTKVLAAVTRIVNAEAQAGGAPRMPEIEHYAAADAVLNDAALAARLRPALAAALGPANVVNGEPNTASEDFSVFVEQGIPSLYIGLGGADPQQYAQAKARGIQLPPNHSPYFAPDVDPALHTAIIAEVAMLQKLMQPSHGARRSADQS